MPIIYAPLPTPALPGGVFSSTCTCPSSVNVGDAVYYTGANAIDKANAIDQSAGPAIGVVFMKPTSTTAIVQLNGPCNVFSSLSPDGVYWLADTAGGITLTPPSGPGEVLQRIGIAQNATTLIVGVDTTVVVL